MQIECKTSLKSKEKNVFNAAVILDADGDVKHIFWSGLRAKFSLNPNTNR